VNAWRAIALALLSLLLLATTPSGTPPPVQLTVEAPHAEDSAAKHESEGGSVTPPAQPFHAEPPSNTADQKTNNYYCNAASGDGALPAWIQAASAFFIAIFTVALIWTSYRQWKALRDAVVKSEEASRLDHRPWVVATGDARLGSEDAGISEDVQLPIQISIMLKNTGETPALGVNVTIEWNLSGWGQEMPNAPKYEDAIKYMVGAIGPGVTHQHLGLFTGMGTMIRDGIRTGSSRFTICGFIEYRSSLDSSVHTTKFCLLWHPISRKFTISGPYNDCT
jgi:hypothetical protein